MTGTDSKRYPFDITFVGTAENQFMESFSTALPGIMSERLSSIWDIEGLQLPEYFLPVLRHNYSWIERSSGPDFDYDHSIPLFSGRTGKGPLLVTWDTNLVIDFLEHGELVLSGRSVTDMVSQADFAEELEALQIILALWCVRDIRLRISDITLRDSKKKPLTTSQISNRLNAYRNFLMSLNEFGPSPSSPFNIDANDELEKALDCVPDGNDRALVRDSIATGQHVFLTRDRGILKAAEALRDFGLLLASPQQLIEELSQSGALMCLICPRNFLNWLLPDPHRMTHMIESLQIDLPRVKGIPRVTYLQAGEPLPFVNPAMEFLLNRIEKTTVGTSQDVTRQGAGIQEDSDVLWVTATDHHDWDH